jgi:predicted dehydrogenase
MGELTLAILGFGRTGSSLHADGVKSGGDFDIVAICDLLEENRQRARAELGCNAYADYREMLGREKPDLVSVVTRSDQHCQMSCDCLLAGANVLVTKPWCLDEQEAKRLMAATKQSGKLLLPWLPARWGADTLRITQLIRAGAIGEVFFVRRFQSSFATRNDWQTRRQFGGGYLLNWGPHLVDTAIGVVGGKVRTAYGQMRQVINPGDVEDVFFAVLTLADGAVVTAEYTVAASSLPNWFIQGTRGTIVCEGRKLTVLSGQPGRPQDPTNYADMADASVKLTRETLEGDSFGDAGQIYKLAAAAIRGQRPFPVSPQEAYELTRVLDAIRKASSENRVVEL